MYWDNELSIGETNLTLYLIPFSILFGMFEIFHNKNSAWLNAYT